jgi:Tfp pilus assembly protein PilF
MAASFTNLGNVASDRGNLDAAWDYQSRSLAIREKLAPNSLDVALNLNNLGNVAKSRGDLSAAQDFHDRALAIRERLAPNSLSVAMSLNNAGDIARGRGDPAAAQDYYRRSLAIKERLAPNSLNVATTGARFIGPRCQPQHAGRHRPHRGPLRRGTPAAHARCRYRRRSSMGDSHS